MHVLVRPVGESRRHRCLGEDAGKVLGRVHIKLVTIFALDGESLPVTEECRCCELCIVHDIHGVGLGVEGVRVVAGHSHWSLRRLAWTDFRLFAVIRQRGHGLGGSGVCCRRARAVSPPRVSGGVGTGALGARGRPERGAGGPPVRLGEGKSDSWDCTDRVGTTCHRLAAARFGAVRGSRIPKSDRAWPVHRFNFNFPRLVAVLVTAVVALVACAHGPGTPAGTPDAAPAFAVTVADQTFIEGEPINPLTLPEASGANGPLSYSLAPAVPGLTFAAATRTLSGMPTMAGSYNVEYRVEDGDANTASNDAATLTFTVTVAEAPKPDTAPSFGSQTVPDQSFTVGEAINALVLPTASGGNGSLSYFLTPSIPGLTFAQNSRTLSGSPTHRRDLQHDLPGAGW